MRDRAVFGGAHQRAAFIFVVTRNHNNVALWHMKECPNLNVRDKMSMAFQDRNSRWQEIQRGLQFIQSTLPFPGTQEDYEVFIQDLVRKLFGEGNDVYKEGDWARALEMYTEALSIAEYADSEDIHVPSETLEKLYANRAAVNLNMGLHDQVLEDCEKTLQHNENNFRALYRKSRSLKELGRNKEAYDAVAKCSLAVPQDESVITLTQELAKILGLKIRKAYVRTKPALNPLLGSSSSSLVNDKCSKGSASVEDIELELPQPGPATSTALPVPGMATSSSALERAESESAPVCAVSSVSPIQALGPERSAAPASGSVHCADEPYPVPESSRLDYDGDIIGDELDELLDRAAPSDTSMAIPAVKGPIPLPASVPPDVPMSSPLLVPSMAVSNPFAPPLALSSLYQLPMTSVLHSLDTFSCMNSLDALSVSETQTDCSSVLASGSQGYGQQPFMPLNKDNLLGSQCGSSNIDQSDVFSGGSDLSKNPLSDTHEFKPACNLCYVKTGPSLLDYTFSADLEHTCKNDILLGRIKTTEDSAYKRIRPRPTKNQYVGPYYICKDVAAGDECRYPGHCTFAYCQEEIDVWTLERKGAIAREMLSDPLWGNGKVNLTVPKLLQEHHGIFMFLCEVCFDHKPRIISKRNKDSPSVCSHPVTKHDFEENKCLVHIFRETTVKYSKVRPYQPQRQLDLCRHELRYGCVREDACFYAHSLIELKVWTMQRETGISHDTISQESRKYWASMEASAQGVQQAPGVSKRFGPPHLKIQFVCGQCWRNGQVSEPDKNKKYCNAKARHPWSKERRVVLVSSIERKKWTTIRPLPTKKPIPSQFDLCIHVSSGKKCQYIGNCTFAHSPEEKDMWTFMKDSNILDMEQLYEHWLKAQKPDWSEETGNNIRENGKQIHMPTDYAEDVAGNHCWLCGKNCNSDKQWQQHITSEKHKEKVFNSEDDQNCWQHRFPTGCFRVCERFLKSTCIEGDNCKLAHGSAELKEWKERREFLLMKLAKARKDSLIAPNDNDFGKYSFLLKDIN
ncbi:zinc finger CCCH domain-containing protein 7A [Lepisosteus oculatus]|uniref:zinc finger CCCH domain-containing protein 7A n=1 Tax=Lepisosteus oculatus TaxID=7918 RepID=UPI0035F5261D